MPNLIYATSCEGKTSDSQASYQRALELAQVKFIPESAQLTRIRQKLSPPPAT